MSDHDFDWDRDFGCGKKFQQKIDLRSDEY